MKARFNNIDIVAAVRELQSLIGLRVTNVYDVDHKSYLFKFAKPDAKVVLLIESGIRLHTTDYEWPKNQSPSGFSMKLRKHVRNRRLESIRQLGVDRIVDMQFGSREAAYHVVLELYDRGNIVLTDHEYMVLNILRPRTDQDTDVRYAVHEKYPLFMARETEPLPEEKEVRDWFAQLKGKEALKKVVGSRLFFGSALVEHALLTVGLSGNQKINADTDPETVLPKIIQALAVAESIYREAAVNVSKGYITYKNRDQSGLPENQENQCRMYEEFHSFPFLQLKDALVLEKPTFLNAVDEFYSLIESQRVDVGILEQQKQALKKLENVQKDHERRLDALRRTQERERLQACLIEENVDLVDRIIVYMRTLMAAELSWSDVAELLERRRERGDEIAEHILKADIAANTVTILLENRRDEDEDGETAEEDGLQDDIIKVDINLNQSAFQNVTRLHTVKKQAAAKESKTMDASGMALRNAERRTKQALKEVATIGTIVKARKTQWFEKFFWFISTENYLVIGGRDAQQNEILVKRYMKSHDFYVHADLHGASSVLVKNPSGGPPPPKTLNEAGVMAMCYSAAWEAKMPAKAWWVFSHQVSKTAPTGEYLGTGSFMIRGKKNFLPPQSMVMGFGFLFKIDEDSVKNHALLSREMEGDVQSETASTAADDDVVLEVDANSDKEDELADEVSEPSAVDMPEMNEGQSFLRSLVSKIISGDEENTLVTSTVSGILPKVAQPKSDPNKKTPATNNSNVAKAEKILPTQKKPVSNANEDDDDWSDYKKNKGKGSRPTKNYNQRHQGLPAKPVKKKGQAEENKTDNTVEEIAVVEVNEESDQKITASSDVGDVEPVERMIDAVQHQKAEKDGQAGEAADDDGDDDDNETPLSEDVQVLRSFIGNPLSTDTIMFCIPVCAPYIAMQDCKVKVKLLPGTAKRGKAAKACYQAFLLDKTLSSMEKDVLKSVKDQDMSRNFPGAVKLAIQQQKFNARRR